jgi:hypothetical protein
LRTLLRVTISVMHPTAANTDFGDLRQLIDIKMKNLVQFTLLLASTGFLR